MLEALASDARFAVVGLLLVVFCVAGMTKSTILTSAAFLCMLLSLPLAYWLYRQVSCTCMILVAWVSIYNLVLLIERMPLLNFFGFFVIIGIGCDGAFLITNNLL